MTFWSLFGRTGHPEAQVTPMGSEVPLVLDAWFPAYMYTYIYTGRPPHGSRNQIASRLRLNLKLAVNDHDDDDNDDVW